MIDTLMAITTKRIPHLPAVLATYKGHITRADIEQMYIDTARLLTDAGDRYYRISDVRGVDTDFREFMGILLSISNDGPFRSGDPQLQVVFVGTNQWVLNVRSVMARKGVPPLTFETMDEAFAYIEEDFDGSTKQSG